MGRIRLHGRSFSLLSLLTRLPPLVCCVTIYLFNPIRTEVVMFTLCFALILWTVADTVLTLRKLDRERRAIDFANAAERVRVRS